MPSFGAKNTQAAGFTRLEGTSPISHGYRYDSDGALRKKPVAVEYTLQGGEAKTEIPDMVIPVI